MPLKNKNTEEITVGDLENKGEFVLYQPDHSMRLEVFVENETIWLSQKLMSTLFDCSTDNISLHLKNIFKENELDEFLVTEDFSVTASDGKNYRVKHYNLDAIIAVGYRVNSKRATAFRQWATQTLRNYLLKGYIVNQHFAQIERKIVEHDQKLFEHSQKFDLLIKTALPPKEGVFYDGQIFDAYAFVAGLVKSAKRSVTLIDNYVDESTLLLLSKRSKGVAAIIYTAKVSAQLQLDLEKHHQQYPAITVELFSRSHDRFLFVDDTVYLIGASLKDLGRKLFAFSKTDMKPADILR